MKTSFVSKTTSCSNMMLSFYTYRVLLIPNSYGEIQKCRPNKSSGLRKLIKTDSRFMLDWWQRQMSPHHALCLQPRSGLPPRTVGRAHVASSPFEVRRGDGWRDRARRLCARERNARALQSPARSLLGPNAQQLIPGCFPFLRRRSFAATLKRSPFSLCAAYWSRPRSYTRPDSPSCSSPLLGLMCRLVA